MAKIKFSKIAAVAATLLMAAAGARAESSTQPSEGTSGGDDKAVLYLVSPASDKKRIPSREHVEVTYSFGMLSLCTADVDALFDLGIEGSDNSRSEVINSVRSCCPVPVTLDKGLYTVTATEESGRTFLGELEITSPE